MLDTCWSILIILSNSIWGQTSISSDNGLMAVWWQGIIKINAVLLLIEPLRKIIKCNFNQNAVVFIEEKAYQNVVCKMAVIFSCDQAALRMFLSICPSVWDTFFTMCLSYCYETFKSKYHWQKWCLCKRSRSRSHRSEQMLPKCGRYGTVYPARTH